MIDILRPICRSMLDRMSMDVFDRCSKMIDILLSLFRPLFLSCFFLSLLHAYLLACLLTCLLAFRCPIDVGGFPVDVRGSFVDTCASPALTLAGHGAESK